MRLSPIFLAERALHPLVARVGQGVVPDFDHERLGRSDVLVALYRRIMARELQAFADGRPLKQWMPPENVSASTGV